MRSTSIASEAYLLAGQAAEASEKDVLERLEVGTSAGRYVMLRRAANAKLILDIRRGF